MPRSRSGGRSAPARAPSRPTVPAPPPRAPQQQQARPMSTAAAPGTTQQAQGQTRPGQSPGLFGQMASTAAGVAVGSSIGHAISGFFGGGSSSQPLPEQQTDTYVQPVDNSGLYSSQGYSAPQAQEGGYYGANAQQSSAGAQQGPCAGDIKNFTTCMEQNRGDLNVCGYYLEMLKACQQASMPY